MRRVAAAALASWLGIMAVGWVLADRRAALCSDTYNCAVHETGTRDAFLVAGLLVPFLLAFVITLPMFLRAGGTHWSPGFARERLLVLDEPGVASRWPGGGLLALPFASRPQAWVLALAAFAMGWGSAWAMLIWKPAGEPFAMSETAELATEAAAVEDPAMAAAAEASYAAIDAALSAARDESEPWPGMVMDQPTTAMPPLAAEAASEDGGTEQSGE